MSTLDDLWASIWTEKHRQLLQAWLGTVIRAALVSAGAWLKATGKFPFLTGETIDKIAAYSPQLAGDAIIFAGLAWSAIQKWRAHREKKTALVMPPESTTADLAAVMKKTQPGIIPTGPIPTPEQAASIVAAAPVEVPK